MCGEKMMKAGSNCAMLGSPPRMRGKGCRDKVKHCFHGITPAYAGKRLPSAPDCRTGWGSPPRMRGKETTNKLAQLRERITPAYAGKSVQRLLHSYNSRDHPRVCGEKFSASQVSEAQ